MDESTQKKKMDYGRAPAFEVLFHLGKKTMRPGGMELTRWMLEELRVDAQDKVVELAPGRGATTRMVLKLLPQSYTAVERDQVSQQNVQEILRNEKLGQCMVGTAQATGLDDSCASVVFGEAMLTMQTRAVKLKIAKEAFRLLAPGGRYGIHETCLKEDSSAELKTEIEGALRNALHVGARPLTPKEWQELLEEAGFAVRKTQEAPMLLLEPQRMIQDEGLKGVLQFISRVITTPSARRRILGMRQTFKQYSNDVDAVALIAVRPK